MTVQATEPDQEFERLLEHVKRVRGFDLTGYKRATLYRRIGKRMGEVGIDSYGAYIDRLEASPDEFFALCDTILINVSSFFRDTAVWRYVANTVIPEILAAKPGDEPIRAWSAGCATGEEAYTLAILLAEAMGEREFRERVKIFATDADEDALDVARNATFPRKQVEQVPEELLDRYFEQTDDTVTVRRDLRRAVIFGRNDLLRDAPISRLDLLTCRNTLMYFNAETQAGVLRRLHLALADGGFLVLGKSETLLTLNDAFQPRQHSLRVFTKVPGIRLPPALVAGGPRIVHVPPDQSAVARAFDKGGDAQLIVDRAGTVLLANERLRELFTLGRSDVGRPLKDLDVSYRPVELRSLLDQVLDHGRAVRTDQVTWNRSDADPIKLEVEVRPLQTDDAAVTNMIVTFYDVTAIADAHEQLTQGRHDLESAYEELQSTVEELETTNEELQSTNEELETTNEELQSTNEELETMNEELQSSNEELETMNEELRLRTDELNSTNVLMESMLGSLGLGVIVVDREMRIQIWNERAKDMWGFGADEVRGRHLMNLDIGLPVAELNEAVRGCLAGKDVPGEISIEARDRRGRDMVCQVRCGPLLGASDSIDGAIILLEVS